MLRKSKIDINFFKEFDNLTPFIHPEFYQRFNYMNLAQQIEMALKIYAAIKKYPRIVVSETGTYPVVFILKLLVEKYGNSTEFISLKIPREIEDQELKRLVISERKRFEEVIKAPFIILDEYIDSGHTFNLLSKFFNLLLKEEKLNNKNFQFVAYMLLNQDPLITKNVSYCLYDYSQREKSFLAGVYPFENRLDYIPYFYLNNQKIELQALANEHAEQAWPLQNLSLDSIFESLKDLLPTDFLISKVRANLTDHQLKNYLNSIHIILYSLYKFAENDPGDILKEHYRQFFYLLYDMYGPIWTPMPKYFHLGYWNAFESVSNYFTPIKLASAYHFYLQNCSTIIYQLAQHMVCKHQHWCDSIKKKINER